MTWHLFPWNAWLLLRDQTTFWWDPYILMAKITSPSITWAAYRIPYSVGYDFFQTSGNIPHIPHVKTKQLEQEWTKLKPRNVCHKFLHASHVYQQKPCMEWQIPRQKMLFRWPISWSSICPIETGPPNKRRGSWKYEKSTVLPIFPLIILHLSGQHTGILQQERAEVPIFVFFSRHVLIGPKQDVYIPKRVASSG